MANHPQPSPEQNRTEKKGVPLSRAGISGKISATRLWPPTPPALTPSIRKLPSPPPLTPLHKRFPTHVNRRRSKGGGAKIHEFLPFQHFCTNTLSNEFRSNGPEQTDKKKEGRGEEIACPCIGHTESRLQQKKRENLDHGISISKGHPSS